MTSRFWKTTLFAAGPGVLACAAMGVVEYSDHESLVIDLVGAYPLVLLVFLPSIPVLAWTLNGAFPDRARGVRSANVRVGWLLASWLAPYWHILAADGVLRALAQPTPVRWAVILRYSACLWFVAAVGRVCTTDRPTVVTPATVARPVELQKPGAPRPRLAKGETVKATAGTLTGGISDSLDMGRGEIGTSDARKMS